MTSLRKIRLYDTYSGTKVELKPINPPQVDIYYCGPTVYNYVHIGNIRPVLTFDLLARVLRAAGYTVRLVSNYTDIDDKIINKALAEGLAEKTLTESYIASYEDTLNKLGVETLYDHPKVSDYIPEIIGFIGQMIATDHAYQADGNVFFRVGSVDSYGSLSKIKIDELVAGARIETDDAKESPLDFALWKDTDKGIKFEAPFGAGRPGWHTECLVMIQKVFGRPLIDIHGGGFDLKFPHHENEIAQSLALNGTKLANIWMHVGFLNFNDEKMSKSVGNVVLAKDAVEQYGGEALRLFFLSTKYEAPINFTEEAINQAQKSLTKYQETLDRIGAALFLSGNWHETGDLDSESFDQFMDALADDLNVANAIAVIEKLCKSSNSEIRQKEPDFSVLTACFFTLERMFDILGLHPQKRIYTDEDRQIYDEFQRARSARDYATSDRLRVLLTARHLL